MFWFLVVVVALIWRTAQKANHQRIIKRGEQYPHIKPLLTPLGVIATLLGALVLFLVREWWGVILGVVLVVVYAKNPGIKDWFFSLVEQVRGVTHHTPTSSQEQAQPTASTTSSAKKKTPTSVSVPKTSPKKKLTAAPRKKATSSRKTKKSPDA